MKKIIKKNMIIVMAAIMLMVSGCGSIKVQAGDKKSSGTEAEKRMLVTRGELQDYYDGCSRLVKDPGIDYDPFDYVTVKFSEIAPGKVIVHCSIDKSDGKMEGFHIWSDGEIGMSEGEKVTVYVSNDLYTGYIYTTFSKEFTATVSDKKN